jgi:hypothetical protein
MKDHPDSPFLWAQRKEPSIFLKDPYFRSKMSTQQATNLNKMHNFTIKQQRAFGAKNLGELNVK